MSNRRVRSNPANRFSRRRISMNAFSCAILSILLSSERSRFTFSTAHKVSVHFAAICILVWILEGVITSPLGIIRPISFVATSRTGAAALRATVLLYSRISVMRCCSSSFSSSSILAISFLCCARYCSQVKLVQGFWGSDISCNGWISFPDVFV